MTHDEKVPKDALFQLSNPVTGWECEITRFNTGNTRRGIGPTPHEAIKKAME